MSRNVKIAMCTRGRQQFSVVNELMIKLHVYYTFITLHIIPETRSCNSLYSALPGEHLFNREEIKSVHEHNSKFAVYYIRFSLLMLRCMLLKLFCKWLLLWPTQTFEDHIIDFEATLIFFTGAECPACKDFLVSYQDIARDLFMWDPHISIG